MPRDSPQTGSRRVRLIKYVAADTEFRLATTLLDERKYPVPALADLYHGRWEIEEFYGVAKELIGEFRGRIERGVKQELYAAFTLIAVSCLFANRCGTDANRGGGGRTDMRSNFKNGLRLLGREIEAMFLAHGAFIAESVARIMTGLSRCLQRERPGRSYPRASKKPRSKWMRRKAALRTTSQATSPRIPAERPESGAFLIRMPLGRGDRRRIRIFQLAAASLNALCQ